MNDEVPRAAPKNSSGWKYAFLALFAAVALAILAGAATLVVAGKAFVCFGISSDLTEYVQSLEKAEFDPVLKREAIERMERIRDDARRGQHVGFWRWLGYDESIRNLIDDGEVSEAEYAALIRELDRLETTN
jgi:hypothetical protein